MSHGEARIEVVPNPGPLSGLALKQLMVAGSVMMLLGCGAFGFQVLADYKLAVVIYLEGAFYALCLAMGGMFFLAINHLVGSFWSLPIRRIMEAMTSYLAAAFCSLIPLVLAYSVIYKWADHSTHFMESKTAYFNPIFWGARVLIFAFIWMCFAAFFRRKSLAQDSSKQPLALQFPAAVYLAVFGFSFTVFSVDLMMSVRPHWFSTMYGVYCFAGMMQAGLCVLVLTSLYLRKHGYLEGVFRDRHLFDLGTWLQAWSTFMVYIGFSQFMLIWYANLPEETEFFIDHFKGRWSCVYIAIFLIKWVVPFFVLMPKPARRCPKVLTVVASLILFAEWLDIHWLISPEYVGANTFSLHTVYGFGVGLGFLGFFALMLGWFLMRHPVIAVGEPKMLSSANGDYL